MSSLSSNMNYYEYTINSVGGISYGLGYGIGSVCPHCGKPWPDFLDHNGNLKPNFLPWLGQCPQCAHEQSISPYNVSETCEQCGFSGMRDDFKNDTHHPMG